MSLSFDNLLSVVDAMEVDGISRQEAVSYLYLVGAGVDRVLTYAECSILLNIDKGVVSDIQDTATMKMIIYAKEQDIDLCE